MATEADIKKMKRGELNALAAEYGLDPDEYKRADDLRSAIFARLGEEKEQAEKEAVEPEKKEEQPEEVAANEKPAARKPNPPRSRLERRSKRYRSVHDAVDKSKLYPLSEAVGLVPEISTVNFDAAVELHIKLGVDTKQADQLVRGTIVLPHGSGKTRRVAALVPEGHQTTDIEKAGADIAGHQNVLEKITKGDIDFDILVAHPDVMKVLSQHAKTLGPQGLMPNPKAGTVTEKVANTVNELKGGRVEYRVDRYGSIHQIVGRASFSPDQLAENITTLVSSILQARPSSIKGAYLQKAYLTTTMGPSIKLDISTLT